MACADLASTKCSPHTLACRSGREWNALLRATVDGVENGNFFPSIKLLQPRTKQVFGITTNKQRGIGRCGHASKGVLEGVSKPYTVLPNYPDLEKDQFGTSTYAAVSF